MIKEPTAKQLRLPLEILMKQYWAKAIVRITWRNGNYKATAYKRIGYAEHIFHKYSNMPDNIITDVAIEYLV